MLKYEDKEPDEYLSWIFAQIRKRWLKLQAES